MEGRAHLEARGPGGSVARRKLVRGGLAAALLDDEGDLVGGVEWIHVSCLSGCWTSRWHHDARPLRPPHREKSLDRRRDRSLFLGGPPGEVVRDRVQLLEMHQVVDAREEQPLAAAQASDERMLERARDAGTRRPAIRPSRPGDDPLALLDLPDEVSAIEPGWSGDARDDARCIGRPPAGGRQRRGHDEPGARGGAWPIVSATVQSSSPPGRPKASSGSVSTIAISASARTRQLGDDPFGRTRAGPAADLAADRQEALLLDAAPGPDDVRRAAAPAPGSSRSSRQRSAAARCQPRAVRGRAAVSGGRSPSSSRPGGRGAATSRRSHGRSEGEEHPGDPPAGAVGRGERARRRGS